MMHKIPKEKILFLDVETVPQFSDWNLLEDAGKTLFEKKTKRFKKEKQTIEDLYQEKASILSEFGKIVCISCGIIINNNQLRLKSFYGHNEQQLLAEFAQMLNQHYNTKSYYLCAHNGKEFDFPYLGRRMLINQITIPKILQIQGLKPWLVQHLDTMELWRFGDYKHYTSLELLAYVLGVPTPKNNIDGSQVASVYYKENNLNKIKEYCEQDVLAVANIFRKMQQESLLELE